MRRTPLPLDLATLVGVVALVTAIAPGLACGPSERTPAIAAAPVRGDAAAPAPAAATTASRSRCATVVDVRELLVRHGARYGTAGDVEASLPLVMSGSVAIEAHTGKTETVLAPASLRSQTWIDGLLEADGVDGKGAWALEGGSGVVERLRPVEGIEPAFDSLLLRRSYIEGFDPSRDTTRCENVGAPSSPAARVDLAYARPELGSPVLSFDLESAALVSTSHTHADGVVSRTTYEAWSEPSPKHVRWARKLTAHPPVGDVSTSEYTSFVAGLACVQFDATGIALPVTGETCGAPLPDRFVMRWPAGDVPRVRLPLTYLGGELLVRARLGGREATAFLDSGAGATAVDATTPAGATFHPSIELTSSGATQKLRLGFGELPAIDLGPLHVEHVPTVSVPIPALDAFGDKRPELILGYSFFAAAAIRVDYIRSEVVLGRTADGLFAKGAEPRPVPLRVLRGKIVVDGTVERAPAPFQVDTGNSGGLDLNKKWAAAHGLSGDRPVVSLKGRFGAGTGETTSMFYRIATGSLGPIAFDGHVAHVADPPDPGILAGLAGNQVLARCDAVIFDVPKRTLWLEGACDRPVPERRMGWRFEKKLDAAFPDRPWVVGTLWPGGAADRAGVRPGDRVLEVGGKPATSDVAPLWALEQQAVGTKVPVVLVRAPAINERLRLIIELRSPAP